MEEKELQKVKKSKSSHYQWFLKLYNAFFKCILKCGICILYIASIICTLACTHTRACSHTFVCKNDLIDKQMEAWHLYFLGHPYTYHGVSRKIRCTLSWFTRSSYKRVECKFPFFILAPESWNKLMLFLYGHLNLSQPGDN